MYANETNRNSGEERYEKRKKIDENRERRAFLPLARFRNGTRKVTISRNGKENRKTKYRYIEC